MKFVLIVMIWMGAATNQAGMEVSFAEFDSETACNEAKALMSKTFSDQTRKRPSGEPDSRAFCVPKGTPESSAQ